MAFRSWATSLPCPKLRAPVRRAALASMLEAAPLSSRCSQRAADLRGYDGDVPGSEVRVTEGDTLCASLNRPTGRHHYPLAWPPMPNAMDGVPYLTQTPRKERGGVYLRVRRAYLRHLRLPLPRGTSTRPRPVRTADRRSQEGGARLRRVCSAPRRLARRRLRDARGHTRRAASQRKRYDGRYGRRHDGRRTTRARKARPLRRCGLSAVPHKRSRSGRPPDT